MAARALSLTRFSAFLLVCAFCLRAQSQKPEDLSPGKILVMRRDARDPHFAESVILLVQYDQNGGLGLMLNRPTAIPISLALRVLPASAGHSDPIFVGGPVQMETVFALTRGSSKPEGASKVLGDVYLLESRPALVRALGGTSDPGRLRIYVGYCGWGRRQLESEVAAKSWYIFNRSEGVAFDTVPETLWSRLVSRAEAQVAGADGAHGIRFKTSLR